MSPRRRINKRKVRPSSKFVAMSKLIGIFIAIFIILIIANSMYEMHYQNDLSSLSQLLISVFGIGGVYIGFYLTMAKWEHIESEKTVREKDLLKLKKKLDMYDERKQCEDDIEKISDEIDELDAKSSELENEEIEANY
jgi:uncharacterized membrane protein